MKPKPVRIVIGSDGRTETEWEPANSEPTCCVEQARDLTKKLNEKGVIVKEGEVLHCKLKLSPSDFEQTRNVLKCGSLGS